jgi:hypothetical protein
VTENYWNSGFTDPAEAGGLLAHEEIHHLGWDGLNTTLAKPTRRSRAAVSSETGLTAPSELEIRFILSSSQHWRFKAGRFRRQHQMWARSWTSSSTPSFRRPRRSRVWRCRRAASPLTLHGRMRRSDMCPSLPRPLWRLGCVEQWKLGTPQCSVTAIPRDVGLVLRSAAASMSRSRRRRVARSRVIGYAWCSLPCGRASRGELRTTRRAVRCWASASTSLCNERRTVAGASWKSDRTRRGSRKGVVDDACSGQSGGWPG